VRTMPSSAEIILDTSSYGWSRASKVQQSLLVTERY